MRKAILLFTMLILSSVLVSAVPINYDGYVKSPIGIGIPTMNVSVYNTAAGYSGTRQQWKVTSANPASLGRFTGSYMTDDGATNADIIRIYSYNESNLALGYAFLLTNLANVTSSNHGNLTINRSFYPLFTNVASPQNDTEYATQNINFTFTVQDDVTEDFEEDMSCAFYLGYGTSPSLNTTNTTVDSGDTVTFVKTALLDGGYNWYINCTNNRSVSNVTSVYEFDIDTKAPRYDQIQVSGSIVNISDNVNIWANWTDTFLDSAVLIVNDTDNETKDISMSDMNWNLTNFTFTPASSFVKQNITFNIRANDTLGNLNTTTNAYVYFRDDVKPDVVLINPANQSSKSSTSITFNYSYSDNVAGNLNCSLYLDMGYNESQTVAATTTMQYGAFAKTVEDNDDHEWYVVCVDSDGNSNITPTNEFTVDSSAPIVNLNETQSSTVNQGDKIHYWANWTYGINQIDVAILYVNGQMANMTYSVGSNNLVNLSYTTNNNQAGSTLSLYMWVNDTAGLEANSGIITVGVNDTIAPSVVPNLPIDNYNTSSLTMNWSAIVTDNNVAPNISCNISVAGNINHIGSGFTNGSIVSTGDQTVPTGVNLWNFTCWDQAGNTATSATRTLNVDRQASLVFAQGYNDSTVGLTKSILVYANVTDNFLGIKNVSIKYGSNAPVAMTPTGDTYSVATTAGALGISTTDNHSVTIIAYDTVNNVNNTEVIYIDVDASMPIVHTVLANETYVKSTDLINFSAFVNDTSLVSVTLNGTNMTGDMVNGGIFYTINSTSDFGCEDIEGTCTFFVSASDTVGNVNDTESVTVTVDDIAPRVTSFSVVDADNMVMNTTSVVVRANITDASVASVTVNGTAMSQSGDYYQVTTTMAALGCAPDGECTLGITATDAAGNINSTETTTITVDTTAPTMNLTYPGNNTWRKVTTPKLNYSFVDAYSDNASCTLSINSVDFTSTVNNDTQKQVYVTGASLSSGSTYTWTVACTDLAGNVGTSSRVIKIDTVKPSTTLTYNNTDAETTWVNTPVNITITATDVNSGVNYTQWRNSTSGSWITVEGSFVLSNNLTDNIIYYRSVDNATNTETIKQKDFYYDGTAPVAPSITLSSDTVGLGGSVVVDVTSSDLLSGLASTADYEINGSTGTLDYSNGKYSGTVTAPAIAGTYNLTITVSDEAGNTVSDANSQITTNGTVASISVNKANGTVVESGSTVTITIDGDNATGWYNYTGGSETNISGTSASVTISGTGLFNLYVYANNTAGLVNQNYTYVIDADAPLTTVTAPTAGSEINATDTITATADDQTGIGVENVVFTVTKVGSTTAYKTFTDTTSPYTFTLDTFAAKDGNYSIEAVATDYFSNSNTSTIYVVINNTGVSTTTNADASGEVDFSATDFATVLDVITGLNDSVNVVVSVPQSVANAPSTTTQLEETIHTLNITTDTPATSRVYFTILTTTLDDLSITSPYSNLYVYVDHGSGVEEIGAATFVDTVTKNGNEYKRFYFETDEYSTFFIGKKAVVVQEDDEETSTTGGTTGGLSTLSTAKGISVTHMWNVIKPSIPSSMSITNDDIAFRKVVFTVTEESQNVRMEITSLAEKPETTVEIIEPVFQYLEVDTTNLDDVNIKSAKISFEIKKSWLNGNNKESVRLLRFSDGKWNELTTELTNEDGTYVYYEATTPGFSYFAIVSKKIAEEPVETVPTEEVEEEVEVEEEEEAAPETKPIEAPVTEEGMKGWFIVIVLVVIGVAAYYWYNKPKKRKNKK